MTSASREARASAAFVALTDTLVSDFDIVDLMHTLLSACVDLLDTDAGALMLGDTDGTLQLMASSAEDVGQIEVIQLGADSGPCLACFSTGRQVTISDIGTDADEWPEFQRAALNKGYRSMHATPLHLRGRVIGVMGLFHATAGALNQQDIALAQSLTDVATIAILQERGTRQATELNAQLQHALDSRIIVEQAKGFVAQSLHVDMDRAFAILRDHARATNQRLQAVAEAVVNRQLTLAADEAHTGSSRLDRSARADS